MVRTKLVAMLLGPSGVGLVGLYVSVTSLVSTISGLGIATSSVRDLAQAQSSGDANQLAIATKVLRRACWFTGFLGWAATVALAYPLSRWTFGSGERATALALLGITILLTALTSSEKSLLQGTRRIGHLACANVISAMASTLIAAGLYYWLGESGIIPVLITTAAASLGILWWFTRQIALLPIRMTLQDTWRRSKSLLRLGLAFMWAGLLSAAVSLVIPALIVRNLGLEASGIYQAAWGISGVFAGFILTAMGTDFYPRLAAVANDDKHVNRLVNEQTEIGVLLALPGLLATLSFSPFLISIFYSTRFAAGAELLPWFVLGVFGQVISWPMGYSLIAKGASRWYLLTESSANLFRLAGSILLLKWLGLWGVSLAFAILYAEHTLLMFWVCQHQTGFCWSAPVLKLLLLSGGLILLVFLLQEWPGGNTGTFLGSTATVGACVFCARGLCARLGADHRVSKALRRLPLVGHILVPGVR